MTVYVDELRTVTPRTAQARRHGRQWCHMMADTAVELHAMATTLGLKRSYCQSPGRPTEHYDLTPAKRRQAVALGAIERSGREMVVELVERKAVPR